MNLGGSDGVERFMLAVDRLVGVSAQVVDHRASRLRRLDGERIRVVVDKASETLMLELGRASEAVKVAISALAKEEEGADGAEAGLAGGAAEGDAGGG